MLVHRGFNNGWSHRKDRVELISALQQNRSPCSSPLPLGSYLVVSQFKSFSIHLSFSTQQYVGI